MCDEPYVKVGSFSGKKKIQSFWANVTALIGTLKTRTKLQISYTRHFNSTPAERSHLSFPLWPLRMVAARLQTLASPRCASPLPPHLPSLGLSSRDGILPFHDQPVCCLFGGIFTMTFRAPKIFTHRSDVRRHLGLLKRDGRKVSTDCMRSNMAAALVPQHCRVFYTSRVSLVLSVLLHCFSSIQGCVTL